MITTERLSRMTTPYGNAPEIRRQVLVQSRSTACDMTAETCGTIFKTAFCALLNTQNKRGHENNFSLPTPCASKTHSNTKLTTNLIRVCPLALKLSYSVNTVRLMKQSVGFMWLIPRFPRFFLPAIFFSTEPSHSQTVSSRPDWILSTRSPVSHLVLAAPSWSTCCMQINYSPQVVRERIAWGIYTCTPRKTKLQDL